MSRTLPSQSLWLLICQFKCMKLWWGYFKLWPIKYLPSNYQMITGQVLLMYCSKDQYRENIISPPLLKNYCIIDPNSICVCKKWTKSRLFRYCSSQKLQLMNGVFGNPRGWWGVSLASIHHSFPPHIFYAGIWTFLLLVFYFQWLLLMMYLHQRKIY